MTLAPASPEQILERLKTDSLYWAESVGKIVNKEKKKVPFLPNPAQRELEAKLAEQREAGKPQRAIVLKARQVGISTYMQAKMVQRTCVEENFAGITVAHDLETAGKLYKMGERFYLSLPSDLPEIKPPRASYKRGRFLHLGEQQEDGTLYPDSYYFVDTAKEGEAGRGGTYSAAHLSEFAFWENPATKLTALLDGIPDTPDSFVVIESTANGTNLFKDMWEDAEAGRSEWVPFFWPWWREEAYTLPFANEAERERFEVGDSELAGITEDEPELVQKFGLTMEQLNWRRYQILNKKQGRVDLFKQEMPATPDEAFIGSGRTVFDPYLVQQVLFDCEITDPRVPTPENPGPERGKIEASGSRQRKGRSGIIDVPTDPIWVPRSKLDEFEAVQWRIWEKPKPDKQYVIGVDVSGGVAGGEQTEDDDLAFDAIQVIEHESRKQVAEYRDRVDEMALARECYLAATYYNEAWLAIEVTGGWGNPVARRCWHDYGYPFLYFKEKLRGSSQRNEDLLGWDTSVQTRPLMIANMAEMLREKNHGIRSRRLALEMKTFVRDPKGKVGPEPNRFSDLLMAYMIAQQVANLKPIKRPRKKPSR